MSIAEVASFVKYNVMPVTASTSCELLVFIARIEVVHNPLDFTLS